MPNIRKTMSNKNLNANTLNLRENPYRGFVSEIASEEGVHPSSISRGIRRGNLRLLTKLEQKVARKKEEEKALVERLKSLAV